MAIHSVWTATSASAMVEAFVERLTIALKAPRNMVPSPTTHAVILAAGRGSRLDPDEGHKLVVELGGRPLLAHHLDNFARLGVRRCTVVTGYQSDVLGDQIRAYTPPDGIELNTAYNPDFDASNGVSVLAGVDHACRQWDERTAMPFWLTMSDHLFEPALFERLDERFDPDDDTDMGAMLAVDAKLGTIFDMDDANKIRCVDGRFEDIGKQLTAFNLVDAGLFWCGRAFVEALRREKADRHDCSTSDAVRRLAAAGRCCFWDIGPGRWQDVDTPQARAHARQLMASWSAAQVSL